MKPGCRPPYVGARRGLLPEYPAYWQVTPDIEAAVALLEADGMVEYEPAYARGGVPVPQLQQVLVASAPARSGGKNKAGR